MSDRSDPPIDAHRFVRERVAAWRAGLLSEADTGRLLEHLRACEECRALEPEGASLAVDAGAHLPASLIAQWAGARTSLQGLERALVRRHLERCLECREDLELLGHAPRLEEIPELESHPGLGPTAATAPTSTIRIVRGAPSVRGSWRDRMLVAWASVATLAAAIALIVVVRRPVVEGVPPPLLFSLGTAASTAGALSGGGPSVRIAPPPRSLAGPVRGSRGGKVTVIPVMGPVPSLALAVRPLHVPDTSWVQVSLVRGDRDTLFTVFHRQWEFFPRRMLVIDGGNEPLEPGRYALVLAGMVPAESPERLESRYLFELRPRTR